MELTYRYEPHPRVRQVVAMVDGADVGILTWDKGNGWVIRFQVDTAHQKQGIGQGMWEYANSGAVPVAERPRRPVEKEHRTAAGDALYWKARSAREARGEP